MTVSAKRKSAVLTGRTAPWLIFLAFALAWTLFHALTAPTRASTDVYIFRDAGCNCAAGEGFVARSVPHNQSLEPELFASYTPGAPLLFAIPARFFGCKPYVDVYYNFFFAVFAAALLLDALLRGASSKSVRLGSALLIGAILPTGLVSIGGDRPEVPAFCLLAVLLLLWRPSRSTPAKTLLVTMNALVFLIHPFAGLVGWLLFCFLLVFSIGQPETLVKRGLTALYGLLGMSAIVGSTAVVMWRIDATSLHRFLQHAMRSGTGAGVVLQSSSAAQSKLSGYIAAFHQIFNSETILSGAGIISLLLAFIAIALFVAIYASSKQVRRSSWMQLLCLAAILLGTPLVLFPKQANYLDLTRVSLLMTIFLGGFELSDFVRRSKLPLFLIGLTCLLLTPSLAISVLENIESRTSYKHATEQAQRTADYFARKGIQDPAMLVSISDYFLYKPYFKRLYAPNYLIYPGGRKNYDGLVLCYTTTLAFTHEALPWPDGLARSGWQLIENGQEDSLRISIFGKPIMRRNWTWSCDVYASTHKSNASD
jgi:hypothetical protein